MTLFISTCRNSVLIESIILVEERGSYPNVDRLYNKIIPSIHFLVSCCTFSFLFAIQIIHIVEVDLYLYKYEKHEVRFIQRKKLRSLRMPHGFKPYLLTNDLFQFNCTFGRTGILTALALSRNCNSLEIITILCV